MAKKNTTKKTSAQTTKPAPAKQAFWKPYIEDIKRLCSGFMTGDTLAFIIGLLIILIGIFLLLALVSNIFTGQLDQAKYESGNVESPANYAGVLGVYCAFYLQDKLFGLTSIFIPLYALMVGMKFMGPYRPRVWKWFLNYSILMIWGSLALSYASRYLFPQSVCDSFAFRLGGAHGDGICNWLEAQVGEIMAGLILVAIVILYLIYLFSETVAVIRKIMRPQDYIKRKGKDAADAEGDDIEDEMDTEDTSDSESDKTDDSTPDEVSETSAQILDLDITAQAQDTDTPEEDNELDTADSESKAGEPEDKEDEEAEDDFVVEQGSGDTVSAETYNLPEELGEDAKPYDPHADLPHYKLPSTDLLDKHAASTGIDMDEQIANKENIIRVLRSFGVDISGIRATVGPTVTLYEITPAPGVRISQIRRLEDDIALSLAALGIRIIAPIPGKGTVGIEVPNKNPETVSMESILNSKAYRETKFELPVALGKTITNDVFMVDLAKLPHLLVAGATGQGKSVGLNALITSLLYKKHPSELKLVMVDPKKVEFSMYSPIINHYLAQVPDGEEAIITDVQKVVQTLKSLCVEMDQRYDLLKNAKCKNIKEYNAKFCERRLSPAKGHRYLPYIVVIIDEFGDLIMTAGKEIELPIARIAQLARAVGIHMVIATQSPRATIITGKIKANFPGRVAFRVAQGVESQTILDRRGANQLIGRGDMLFLSGSTLVRVQCAFVDTPEVERITNYISEQPAYPEPYMLPEVLNEEGEAGGGIQDVGKLDTKFREVATFVVSRQTGSTSLVQRYFEIGYTRAARIMDQLEKAGVVGPAQGAKPREVYIQDETSLDNILESLGG